MNTKNNIIILLIAIVVYIVISITYQNLTNKNKYIDVYVLNKDVQRGNELSINDLVKIKVLSDDSYLKEYDFDINKKYVFKDFLYKNQIINSSVLIKKDEYVDSKFEIVSIKLDSIDDAASFQIEKGNIVNIFYTSKTQDISNVLGNINKENIILGKGGSEAITLKLFENVKILNTYNKEGQIIKEDSTNKLISTISMELTKENAILVNSLKSKGNFIVTIVR